MSTLKSIRLPVSANLKLTLVGLAFLIVAGTLYYTQYLVEGLKHSERKTLKFYANLLQTSAGPDAGPDLSDLVLTMTQNIDFPIILTDPDGEPKSFAFKGDTSFLDLIKNIPLDTSQPAYLQRQYLIDRTKDMGEIYEPLPVFEFTENSATGRRDSSINTLIFYDDSGLIKQIRLVPVIGIVIIAMFILVGYISFSHIKRNEQSNIWVGMAKETAHQLGTPLSSMLGWIELLRLMPEDKEQVLEAAGEMERDVERLNRIAHRFSKIGSAAQVTPVEIGGVLRNVQNYFERRLPHLGRKVSLLIDAPEPIWVAINVDLFEWVFENLVRNAADAIDHPDGVITLSARKINGAAYIDVSDNGRGIDAKIRKDIFRPGFSTKSRGWGLGLSLAKRIVEEYHGGKITIKQTSSAGTTFRIRLEEIISNY
jgi:signal transduction histidine kinase